MNVFILNTGRCGSTTFIKACQHITNYSCAHESNVGNLGFSRFNYPENHIEADNRLSWFLGKLDKSYGDDAFYVHLKRDENDTAKSFIKRYELGIIKAYKDGILIPDKNIKYDPLAVSLDYYETVNSNIDLFLKDKTHKMQFNLENAKEDFIKFWNLINAEGDLNAALLEFDINYNTSEKVTNNFQTEPITPRIFRKIGRIIKKFPEFIKKA